MNESRQDSAWFYLIVGPLLLGGAALLLFVFPGESGAARWPFPGWVLGIICAIIGTGCLVAGWRQRAHPHR